MSKLVKVNVVQCSPVMSRKAPFFLVFGTGLVTEVGVYDCSVERVSQVHVTVMCAALRTLKSAWLIDVDTS